jgi:squalene-hopene/tetraprenyl-beta-curcumene cyclase
LQKDLKMSLELSTKTREDRAGSAPGGATRALERAVAHLLGRQHKDGHWKSELETNVTMEAEDLLLRRFLGIHDDETAALTANWIRHKQQPGGGWATFHGGPAELSTTIEAYTALRLAGDPPDADHMRRAAQVALDLGGIEKSRVFTRIWLALFGEWSWRDLPALPPEVVLLPAWFPLNIYDFACWARQTIVPLTIVAAHRPQRELGFDVRELRTRRHHPEKLSLRTWGGSRPSTGRSTSTSAIPSVPCATTPCAWGPSGSCAARKPTAAGAASSRPGCTR